MLSFTAVKTNLSKCNRCNADERIDDVTRSLKTSRIWTFKRLEKWELLEGNERWISVRSKVQQLSLQDLL